jgi:hypothetical protein
VHIAFSRAVVVFGVLFLEGVIVRGTLGFDLAAPIAELAGIRFFRKSFVWVEIGQRSQKGYKWSDWAIFDKGVSR